MALQFLSVMAGVSSLTAAACNSMLGLHVKSPILGAAVAFTIGSAILLCAVFFTAPSTGAFEFSRKPKLWELMGGVCGMIYMVTIVYVTPELGAAGLFSAVVAGQLGSSVIVDWIGLNGATPVPLTISRAVCVLVAAFGASLAAPGAHEAHETTTVLHASAHASPTSHPAIPLLALATAAAGAMQPLQAALNARVASLFGPSDGSSPKPLPAAALSFSLSAFLTLFLSAFLLRRETWAHLTVALITAPPMALFGAPAQALTLVAGATIPRFLGTANYYTLLICGEMAGGLLADSIGALGLEQRAPTLKRVGGALLICIAAAMLGSLSTKKESTSSTTTTCSSSSSSTELLIPQSPKLSPTAKAESIATSDGCKLI